ncbi:MAG: phosphatidylglycerol lysyltransferase domain-containing protein, partial [Desulfobacterales bacterium]|nr:phosphatidylglycerol lysyltransferase domain-containing protein [Desulfobacterales bacterium]
VPQSLIEEAAAIEKAFDNWDRLGLEGLVVTVDDNIAAFAVFSPLNLDTFNVHFEKANIAYKGAAQVINQETARYLSDRAVYINREQDLGIPGLRQAKMSYDPHRLLVPWVLKLKANA